MARAAGAAKSGREKAEANRAPAAGPGRTTEVLVLIGGGGDLALRMLLPSLYRLHAEKLSPPDLQVIAVARREEARDAFVARVAEAAEARLGGDFDAESFAAFAETLDYVAADAGDPAGLTAALGDRLKDKAALFYLSVSPSLYTAIAGALAQAGLAGDDARVVMEKPIGRDLESSQAINAAIAEAFDEQRVFRIDHYLGKETVQNLIALRFANVLFEPLWNNLSIDSVQITVAETGGVGERWPYYDEYGALRDMLQNHMLQLLCLVAMEPPSDLNPDSVRNEKVKVLRSLRRITPAAAAEATVRGQYTAGVAEGEKVPAYAEERGQATPTETFVALRAEIDNWRWAGVPFFLRTGKRLPERVSEIVIQFKPVPHSIFGGAGGDLTANRLVIRLQPQEDIQLLVMNQERSLSLEQLHLKAMPLSLSLEAEPGARRRIAYERLLLDAMEGRQTLFVRRDEAEEAWRWIDAIEDSWDRAGVQAKPYPAGSWGPGGAFALTERSGRAWHE